MPADDLHRPLYTPDLLVNALSSDPGRPLLHLLDGPTLSVGEVRDATVSDRRLLRDGRANPRPTDA